MPIGWRGSTRDRRVAMARDRPSSRRCRPAPSLATASLLAPRYGPDLTGLRPSEGLEAASVQYNPDASVVAPKKCLRSIGIRQPMEGRDDRHRLLRRLDAATPRGGGCRRPGGIRALR